MVLCKLSYCLQWNLKGAVILFFSSIVLCQVLCIVQMHVSLKCLRGPLSVFVAVGLYF